MDHWDRLRRIQRRVADIVDLNTPNQPPTQEHESGFFSWSSPAHQQQSTQLNKDKDIYIAQLEEQVAALTQQGWFFIKIF